jgi:hypothetical protein
MINRRNDFREGGNLIFVDGRPFLQAAYLAAEFGAVDVSPFEKVV